MQLLWPADRQRVEQLLPNKKLLIFDLDGTLVLSKSHLQSPMAKIIGAMLRTRHVAIISGCGYSQMYNQFAIPMINALRAKDYFHAYLSRLYLLPMSGTSMYKWDRHESRFAYKYKNVISLRDKASILGAFDQTMRELGVKLPIPYGRIEEDRETQITFSLRGQEAPLEIKETFDAEGKLRLKIKQRMEELLPFNEVRVGGTTSLDVTPRGADKAFGVGSLLKDTRIYKKDSVFIGDALFEGGNDASVKKTNIDCIEIGCPVDTLEMLAGLAVAILSKEKGE